MLRIFYLYSMLHNTKEKIRNTTFGRWAAQFYRRAIVKLNSQTAKKSSSKRRVVQTRRLRVTRERYRAQQEVRRIQPMNSSVSDSGDQLIQKLKLNVTKLPKITTPFRTDFSLTWEGSPLKSLPNGNGMVMAIHPPTKPKVASHKIVRALSRHAATANDKRSQN